MGLVAELAVEALQGRVQRVEFYLRPPLQVAQAATSGVFYQIGVGLEAPFALSSLGLTRETHAPYIERDIDADLRRAFEEAIERQAVTLIVVSGHSKTGKSRTLLEASAAVVPLGWLLVPNAPGSLVAIAGQPAPVKRGQEPILIWLDDLEDWVGPRDEGLNPLTLEGFSRWKRSVLLLATEGARGASFAGSSASQAREIKSELLVRARRFRLDWRVSRAEAARLSGRFGEDAITRVEHGGGIALYMIAAPRLIERLEGPSDCPEGQAIVWAAIDMRRAGLDRPSPADSLEGLFAVYLASQPSADAFHVGLAWATQPLYGTTALLSRVGERDKPDVYTPHDYVVDNAWQSGREIEPIIWDRVIDEFAEDERDLESVATVAHELGDNRRAERAARRADEYGFATGANNVGLLLAESGDLRGARDAWLRADKRGDPSAPANLGRLLKNEGDLTGAKAVWRRADERGHAGAACDLGDLLREEGDWRGAEAAWRRADEGGSARGAYNLGVLLEQRSDPDAEAAYERADERGSGGGANNLGSLYQQRGEVERAEAAYRRADARGNVLGALNLAILLDTLGDHAGAEAAYVRADDRGSGQAASWLGVLLHGRDDLTGAEAAWRRGDDRGDAASAYLLGVLLAQGGNLSGAEAAWRRALTRATSDQNSQVAEWSSSALEKLSSGG